MKERLWINQDVIYFLKMMKVKRKELEESCLRHLPKQKSGSQEEKLQRFIRVTVAKARQI